MSDTTQISEVEAIRKIVAESEVMDFVDVVTAVKRRFRLDVTSAQVEQVVRDLDNPETQIKPRSRVSVGMTAKIPSVHDSSDSTKLDSTPSRLHQPTDQSENNLAHALHFVKSVGSLANAKLALEELEAMQID